MMNLTSSITRFVYTFLVVLLMLGCATRPQVRQQQICPACTPVELKTSGDLPPILAQTRIQSASSQRLHVYLEGDGRPWTRYDTPNDDPNSHQLTALELMQLDTENRVYINRPCYGVMPLPSSCSAELWTSGRYSSKVVNALNDALNQIQNKHPTQELVLIGHSGGGTLAMLLAAQRRDVVAVITLAGNLDHRAWTASFGYLPLLDSLNAAEVKLSPNVLRWHFAGSDDKQVPIQLIKNAAAMDSHARLEVFEGFDHTCCWTRIWPKVLADLQSVLDKQSASKQ